MVLRAKIPRAGPRRLKLLLFGAAGVGKTTGALQMPRPYCIDCERGAVHYGALVEEGGGAVFNTVQMTEVLTEVRALLSERHDFRTLIVDPITAVYQDLLDQSEREVGTEWGRHYGAANREMKRLANLLMALDMNVIMTAHSKNEYGSNMAVIGTTFDGWKKLDYLFDLVLQLERRGQKRVARVVKSRLAEFPDADVFEWRYESLADRYGRDVLEREADVAPLATPEHVQIFNNLLTQLSEPEKRRLGIDRALARVEAIADMPDDRVVRGIELIKNHLEKDNQNVPV